VNLSRGATPPEVMTKVTDNQWKAVELRSAGASYREIGAALGISHEGARRMVMAAMEQIPVEQCDYMRKVDGERIDRLQRALWPKALGGDVKAIMAITRLMERRAKLFGLDAPVKVDATVTEVTQADIEMEELIREYKAGEGVAAAGR
jgi:hypothetical protein